jgi:sulfatase maturation enzyme AslB (radical SAM superfamily)
MCWQDHSDRTVLDLAALIEHVDLSPFTSIEIQGGEPLAIPQARRFFELAAQTGRAVSFMTNGTIMSPEWAERIALSSSFIHFSLNAATKHTHEAINRGSSWEKVLRNICLVRSAKYRLNAALNIHGHVTIIPANLVEVPLFIRRFQDFGFDTAGFGFDRTIPAVLEGNPPLRSSLRQQIEQELTRLRGDAAAVHLPRLGMLGLVGSASEFQT